MKKLLILCLPIALVSFTFTEKPREIIVSDFHVECHGRPGMLDGEYISFWKNGKKKAAGEMSCNRRAGEWKLWDSTGKLLMIRRYSSVWSWTCSYPANANPANSYSRIDTTRQGFLKYNWQQDSLDALMRLWYYVPYDERNPIFLHGGLIDSLIKMSTGMDAHPMAKDDEFRIPYSPSEFARQLDLCDPVHRLLGYRIKEDWLYDYTMQTGVRQIVALCPVLQGKTPGDSVDLAWFYYPPLEVWMSSFEYLPRHRTAYPENLADQFSGHCFAGIVYKTSNKEDRPLNELYSGPKLALEQQFWELAPYEYEHDAWFAYYSRK